MTDTNITNALIELKDLSPYALASMADCGTPDTMQTDGAKFLASVRNNFVDAVEYAQSDMPDMSISDILDHMDSAGELHQIADDAPDVYTAVMWSEFLDLSAYNEDPSEYMLADCQDMGKAARVCLFMIAERLLNALSDQLRTDIDDADSDE
jgi:hypothetical protein